MTEEAFTIHDEFRYAAWGIDSIDFGYMQRRLMRAEEGLRENQKINVQIKVQEGGRFAVNVIFNSAVIGGFAGGMDSVAAFIGMKVVDEMMKMYRYDFSSILKKVKEVKND